jgi:hypothetical protein
LETDEGVLLGTLTVVLGEDGFGLFVTFASHKLSRCLWDEEDSEADVNRADYLEPNGNTPRVVATNHICRAVSDPRGNDTSNVVVGL